MKLIAGELDTCVVISVNAIFQCPKVIFLYKAALMQALITYGGHSEMLMRNYPWA